MHCEDPGCLKACPAPGAIVQYSNGIVDFIHENCIGCGYCVSGCPFDIPRISKVDPHRLQVHALLRPRRGGRGAGLRQGLPDPVHHLRPEGGAARPRRRARRGPEVARLRERRHLRPGGRRRHPRDLRAAPRRQAGDLRRPAGRPADLAGGRGLEGRHQDRRPRRHRRRWPSAPRCTASSPARTRSRRATARTPSGWSTRRTGSDGAGLLRVRRPHRDAHAGRGAALRARAPGRTTG